MLGALVIASVVAILGVGSLKSLTPVTTGVPSFISIMHWHL